MPTCAIPADGRHRAGRQPSSSDPPAGAAGAEASARPGWPRPSDARRPSAGPGHVVSIPPRRAASRQRKENSGPSDRSARYRRGPGLLLDPLGPVPLQSRSAATAELPAGASRQGYRRTETLAFHTTEADTAGYTVHERWEACRDSLLALLVPIPALLPLVCLLVGWIARRALRPLGTHGAELAARGEGRLDQIDAAGQRGALRAIVPVTLVAARALVPACATICSPRGRHVRCARPGTLSNIG